ncbi:MAG TPA: FG-GAP-like repeat-containing protein [Candidatus Binatia bacterium]|nr:FG-GAP-like repeat-containing protein [Candidatus Binatia bacterium]
MFKVGKPFHSYTYTHLHDSFWASAAVVDFNGDGRADLLMGFEGWGANGATGAEIPIQILLGNGSGEFKGGTSTIITGGIPTNKGPNEPLVADFNGDGHADVFIGDFGKDGQPFGGYNNTLLLSDDKGHLTNAGSSLPVTSDLTHGEAAGDIDGDGDLDIYVINLASAGAFPLASYFLINDGKGNFTESTSNVPAPYNDLSKETYDHVTLADLDGDKDLDLLLMDEHGTFGNVFLLNDGKGSFTAGAIVPPDGKFGKGFTQEGDVADINHDGRADVVLTVSSEGNASGSYVQILVQDKNGNFVDETDSRLPQPNFASDLFNGNTQLVDMDGDGDLDIVAAGWGASSNVAVFFNDGTGHFGDRFSITGPGTPITVADINGDLLPDFIWEQYAGPTKRTLIVELNTSKAGNDTFSGTDYDETLIGGGGSDVVDGGLGNDTIHGGTGNDSLKGGDGDDILLGEAGNDSLRGGPGTDQLVGGAGNDTYFIDDLNDSIVEAANGGTADTVVISVDFNLLSDGANVERLTVDATAGDIDGTGNDLGNTMRGNDGNNALTGGGGNDIIIGNGGDDRLDGGLGNDMLIGGAGSDIYIVDSLHDKIVESLTDAKGGGIDTVDSDLSLSLAKLTNIDNLTLEGPLGTETLNGTGNALANRLEGNDGNNLLNGGKGIDTFIGHQGDDIFVLDNAAEADAAHVVEQSGEGSDTVIFGSFQVLSVIANVENYTYAGTKAWTFTGDGSDNHLVGGSGADTLSGAGGDDTLNGGKGADNLAGGAGNDTYVVGDAKDKVAEVSGEGSHDLVESAVTWTLGAEFEDLILIGKGAVSGIGNSGDNLITGNAGKNTLMGLDGADTIAGGGGDDRLSGGLGTDSFVYDHLSDRGTGKEVITDFSKGEDTLNLHGLLTEIGATGDPFANGYLNLHVDAKGNTVVQVDADGGGNKYVTLVTIQGVALDKTADAASFVF